MSTLELLEHRVKEAKGKSVKGVARLRELSIEGRGYK
jgi:hypothetical protein